MTVRGIARMTTNGLCAQAARPFYGPGERSTIADIERSGGTLHRLRHAVDRGLFLFAIVTAYSRAYALLFWTAAFVGIAWFLPRLRERPEALPLLVIIGYLAWASSGAAHVRYRLHFEPIAMVFAGGILDLGWRKGESFVRMAGTDGLRNTIAFTWHFARVGLARAMNRPFITREIHGSRMRLDTRDPGVSLVLALYGTREIDQVEMVREVLKPGMTCLDVGANIGSYALLEARIVGDAGRVYALEPSPANAALLEENVRLNHYDSIIEVFQIGAAEKSGSERFYLHSASNLHTFHPEKYQEFREQEVYQESIEIDVVNVCEFLADKRPVGFVRMDVEGFEVEVLSGMLDCVESGVVSPAILFECHRPKYDDAHHSMREPLGRLLELGYYARTVSSTNEDLVRFGEFGYRPQSVVRTDSVYRGLYKGISNEDCLKFVCDVGGVRAVLLDRSES